MNCNDQNEDVNPDANEVPENGIDEDCDGIDGNVQAATKIMVSIFPNPTNGISRIESQNNEVLESILLNAYGQTIYSNTFQSAVDLDLSDLPSGIYWLRISEPSTGKAVLRKISKL